jgi:hypothetical protein
MVFKAGALKLLVWLAFSCLILFAVTAVTALVCDTRIEETFEPLASPSCELATLAFFAVFKVLIRDFFWMDIVGS